MGSADSGMETVTFCSNCSFHANLVGMKDLNRYVYPRGEAVGYHDLHERNKFFVFNILSNNV